MLSCVLLMVSLEMSFSLSPSSWSSVSLENSHPLSPWTFSHLHPLLKRIKLGYWARSECMCSTHKVVGLNQKQSASTHPRNGKQNRNSSQKRICNRCGSKCGIKCAEMLQITATFYSLKCFAKVTLTTDNLLQLAPINDEKTCHIVSDSVLSVTSV